MNRRIAIVAALPRELKPLVKGWQRELGGRFVSLWAKRDEDGDELIAVCAGMGANAARRAFAAAEARGALDLVINVGLAGATDASSRLGAVCCVNEVVDVQTGERFALTSAARRLRLATVAQTADAAEKRRLLASYGAVLVDMEAATVARLAAMREMPMCCFKSVSDGADAALPAIDRFVDAEGQLSVRRFLTHLVVRPRSWVAVARLARDSGRASEALAMGVREFLRHKDWEFTNRTGSFVKPIAGVS